MGTDAEKNREKYLAMLKTAVEEARIGLREGGIPIGAVLFEREGNFLDVATTAECKRAILPRMAKRMLFEKRAGSGVTATKSW